MIKPGSLPAQDEQDSWPFDEIIKSHRLFKRAQKQKFQNYIVEHDPALTIALEEEAARFDIVRLHIIEPLMLEAAELATSRGFHVFVTNDETMDRLVLLASPSIRFYCSRRAFDTPVNELLCSPSFVAFYGCCQTHTVKSYVELSEVDTPSPKSTNEPPLEYSEVNLRNIRVRLSAFIDSLPPVIENPS